MHDDLASRARELARRLPIADSHIDLPWRLEHDPEDIARRTERGDFDLPRARQGGLDLAFLAIYVPAAHQRTGDAKAVADRLIDRVQALCRAHPDALAPVASVAETRAELGNGRVAVALGLENAAPLQGRVENLRHFHERGVRYVTLTHSRANDVCDSSFDAERPWRGLSPFGRELVAAMNRQGTMVDVSHVSDEAFDQILELSQAPPFASHSSCRRFTPGWERNLSDDMIRRLASAGGVVQINFGSAFLNDRYRRESEAARERIVEARRAEGLDPESPAGFRQGQRQLAELGIRHADVSEVADHIDHVVRLVGVDHVGLGSDFDGVGDSLPVGLEDVSAYPNLIRVLLERGYDEEPLEKICAGNLLRAWSEAERVAADPHRRRG